MAVNIADTYNDWVVIGKGSKPRYWLCRCKCGNTKEIQDYSLTHGKSKSCGKCNKVDINIGDTFGEWTVISEVEDYKVKCRCSCGKSREVSIYTLKSGASTSCGHTMNQDRVLDLTGAVFGELTAKKYIGNSRWECLCSCRNTCIKERSHLLDGRAKSCGHETNHIPENLTNIRFGKLVAQRYIGNKTWECKCDCGNTKNILSANLKNGSTISCGCAQHIMSADEIRSELKKFNEVNGRKARIDDLAKLWGLSEGTVRYHLAKVDDSYLYMETKFGSKFEAEVYELIKSMGVDDIVINSFDELEGYQLDLYLPKYRLGIEFNGSYWHSELHKDTKYHQIKSVIGMRNNIHIIHIFEHEWVDEKQKNKIINLIRHRVCPSKVIYARETNIRYVPNKEARNFLNQYHIQNYTDSKYYLGCYYNNELLGIMAIGNSRFDAEYDLEIHRICWKEGISVVGGNSKIFAKVIKDLNPNSVVSYCDISKFSGKSYTAMGFKYEALTKPGYIWVNLDTLETKTRFKFDKNRLIELGLASPDETEVNIMHKLGYVRVYNSGNIKFTWSR